MIKVSAPCKIHLLGEHAVVYGKPALLAAVDLRVTVTLREAKGIYSSPSVQNDKLKKIIEPIIKNELKIKNFPPYNLEISSQIPIGAGLGSSGAVSSAYIAALLSFLKVKWDLNLINKLAYEAEKVFHGNPSGADPATVIFGGLIWFRKESSDLKIIHQLPFSIPNKLSKNFVIINTGTPKQTTKDMVVFVKNLYDKKPKIVQQFLEIQEKLVKELLPVIKEGNEKEFIRIIKEGEKNLESIGVASKFSQDIIREIEKVGGAAKICGAGASDGPTGVLLCYHSNPQVIKDIAKGFNLDYFQTNLGVEGLRRVKGLVTSHYE